MVSIIAAKSSCKGSSGTRTAIWPPLPTPMAEPTHSGTTAAATTLPMRACVPSETRQEGTIEASVVPRTVVCGRSVMMQSAGVTTSPPPTPKRPEASPEKTPTTANVISSTARASVGEAGKLMSGLAGGVAAPALLMASVTAVGESLAAASPRSVAFARFTKADLRGTYSSQSWFHGLGQFSNAQQSFAASSCARHVAEM
mmetsp:Transcript_3930/g.7645  ORF Transcript_3930/g.7645 Transcript_3930/m.7645 type:complete len:200 (-) Transcript_3930:367-966(-)